MQKDLRELMEAQVQEQGILGLGMALRAMDGRVIGVGVGVTDPDEKNDWSPETRSALGSITKTFTAVVIMQLVEAELLSLDDTIDGWFPDQPQGDEITVRMLLSHTSGLNTYINGAEHLAEIQAGEFASALAPEELVAKANEAGPVDVPGSEQAHYANTNYILLGLITEELTGNSWFHEVEERIIDPLKLNDTTFLSKRGTVDTLVGGYLQIDDEMVNLLDEEWYPHASSVWSAGEIVSTASDMLTFASALFDGTLVSSTTLAEMATPLGTDENSGILWGLGGGTIDGLPPGTFGMGGDIPGYHAFFMGIVGTDLVVATLLNSEEGDAIGPTLMAVEYLASLHEEQVKD